MIDRLGIIPAAGVAKRWGGIPKELLPVDEITLLDRTIMSMYNADVILLITNEDKAAIHIQHLKNQPIYYAIQQGKNDIWSAIVESLPLSAKMTMFAMPDTYFNIDIFQKMPDADFNIGYFETIESERFGIIRNNAIINKQKMAGIQRAWGVLSWSNKVVDLWKHNIGKIENYTDAINMAMLEFGYSIIPLDYYEDIGSWEFYKQLIGKTNELV